MSRVFVVVVVDEGDDHDGVRTRRLMMLMKMTNDASK